MNGYWKEQRQERELSESLEKNHDEFQFEKHKVYNHPTVLQWDLDREELRYTPFENTLPTP